MPAPLAAPFTSIEDGRTDAVDGRRHVVVVSPSVHVRVELARQLRRRGVHPYLFRSWAQFRRCRAVPGGRILLLDPHALPPSCSRDTWTRRTVAEPSTRILDDEALQGIVPELRGGVAGAAATA